MAQLDDLVARSRSPGKFVERRRFTLSREKAIEKQREFALRHPRQYVLELVQAGVFAGATYMAIDARPDSILVAWVGGQAIRARDLESLLDYLFADRADARHRHLVQLAVGVNAILQRKPRKLRIETGAGDLGVRMDLDHRGRGEVGEVEDAIGGTYLYAEFSGGWLARFSGSSWTQEQSLVEERCLYTPVPILLNGSAPFGYRGSRHIEIFGAHEQVHFDGDHNRRGVVARHTSPHAPRGFRLVVGGVWVTTDPMEALATEPLIGVICDDQLRKTADHSDIVRDDRYLRMVHAVQPHATELMRQSKGPRYRPPPLPPVPEVMEPDDDIVEEEAPAVALPAALDAVSPRTPVPLAQLLKTASDTPLFWCAPADASGLQEALDPQGFPWRVLILTAGQASALERQLEGIAVHRLATRADVDFVRRVVERDVRTRAHTVSTSRGDLVLRLHLEGGLPDWGEGAPGVPWLVASGGRTRSMGSIDGARVHTVSGGAARETSLRTPLHLPSVSLLLQARDTDVAPPDDDLCARALSEAWRLAVPDHGPPHRALLAGVLGQVALPQFQARPQTQLGAALPVGFPEALRHVPLAETERGPLALEDLLALMGTTEVLTVHDADELAALQPLERRFGFGHLTHPALEGRPVFGVGRVGARWEVLDTPEAWEQPGLTQLIYVASTFRPRLQDAAWDTEAHPHPELVALHRTGIDPDDTASGWQLLYECLERRASERDWTPPVPGVDPERGRGMGRLALLHLADLLGHTGAPLLVPSDRGARRSLDEVRGTAAARIVADHGVEVAEPWTFRLTRDELAVVEGGGHSVALRYDDAPDVWTSLTRDEPGWLLRRAVRHAGLAGWLGLRLPYDGTSGILVRSTGRMIALRDVDRRVPCHGLLWPESGARDVTPEQARLIQLAGLRLYQELASILRTHARDEREEAARRYGFAFVLRAWRRVPRLSGTARELAQLIEVRDASDRPWGTLEQWLTADPEHRPPPPEGVLMVDVPEAHGPPGTSLAPVAGEVHPDAVGARLEDALDRPELAVKYVLVEMPRGPVATVEDRRDGVRVLLNDLHPLVKLGRAQPGPAREALLLELARRVCAATHGGPIAPDFLAAQQVLLAQRLT